MSNEPKTIHFGKPQVTNDKIYFIDTVLNEVYSFATIDGFAYFRAPQ